MNQILHAIHVLNSKVDLLKDECSRRFDQVENRLSIAEKAIIRFAGPNTLSAAPADASFPTLPSISHSVPLPPSAVSTPSGASQYSSQPTPANANTLPSPGTVGSRQNVSFLPNAIQMIAWTYQRKYASDKRTW